MQLQLFSITLIIIIINCVISYIAINNPTVMNKLILTPYWVERKNEYYRFLTSGFIHADYKHLIFNMISLYFFGYVVEAWLGQILYVLLYLSAIIISDIPTYLKYKNNSNYASLGASGAVSAIIFASILLHPINLIFIYFIPMPAFVFGILYLAYSYYMDKQNRDHINHSAHFYGAVVGIAFIAILYPSTVPAMFETIMGAIQGLLR
jgi:membrane associated rhomboid family serine protease